MGGGWPVVFRGQHSIAGSEGQRMQRQNSTVPHWQLLDARGSIQAASSPVFYSLKSHGHGCNKIKCPNANLKRSYRKQWGPLLHFDSQFVASVAFHWKTFLLLLIGFVKVERTRQKPDSAVTRRALGFSGNGGEGGEGETHRMFSRTL